MSDDAGLSSGIDLIEIERIAVTVRRFGQRFLDRIYTQRELAYCRGRTERLAGRFAAKEAVSKALGVGIRRLRWRDIEVLPNRAGKPEVYLYGKAAAAARFKGINGISVSITHSRTLAAAVAIGFSARGHTAGNSQQMPTINTSAVEGLTA
jgi:holo-[acyl-carrier protein] synthase